MKISIKINSSSHWQFMNIKKLISDGNVDYINLFADYYQSTFKSPACPSTVLRN